MDLPPALNLILTSGVETIVEAIEPLMLRAGEKRNKQVPRHRGSACCIAINY